MHEKLVADQSVKGIPSRNSMEGQTEHLFASDSEMMDYELWEGIQKLALNLIEAKFVMIPKSKRTDPNHPWALADTMALFPNEHRNKIMLRNLGNTMFQTYWTSTFYTSVATDMTTVFLRHCRSLFTIPLSCYLSRCKTEWTDGENRRLGAELCRWKSDQQKRKIETWQDAHSVID